MGRVLPRVICNYVSASIVLWCNKTMTRQLIYSSFVLWTSKWVSWWALSMGKVKWRTSILRIHLNKLIKISPLSALVSKKVDLKEEEPLSIIWKYVLPGLHLFDWLKTLLQISLVSLCELIFVRWWRLPRELFLRVNEDFSPEEMWDFETNAEVVVGLQ